MRFLESLREHVLRVLDDLVWWFRQRLDTLERPLDRFDEAVFSPDGQRPAVYVVATFLVMALVLYVFSHAHTRLENLDVELAGGTGPQTEQAFSDDERLFELLLAERIVYFDPETDLVKYVPRDCLQMSRPSSACPAGLSRDALKMLHRSAPGAVIRQEIDRWNQVRSLVAVRGLVGTFDSADSQRGLWQATVSETGITMPTHSMVPEEFGFIHQGKLSVGFGDWNALSGLDSNAHVIFTLNSTPRRSSGFRKYAVQLVGCLDQDLVDQNRRAGWKIYRLPAKMSASRRSAALSPAKQGDRCDLEASLAYRLVRPWPGYGTTIQVYAKPSRFSPDRLPGYALQLKRSTWSAMRVEHVSKSLDELAEIQRLVELRGPGRDTRGTPSELRILQENFRGKGTSWRIAASEPGVQQSEYRLTLAMPENINRLASLRLAIFGRVESIELIGGLGSTSDPLSVDASSLWTSRKVKSSQPQFIRLSPRISAFRKLADRPSMQFVINIRHAHACSKITDESCKNFEGLRYASTVKRNVDVTQSAGFYLYSRDSAPKPGEESSKSALVRPAMEGGLDISREVQKLGLGPIVGMEGLTLSRVAGAMPRVVSTVGKDQYQLSIDRRIQELAQASLMRQFRSMGAADTGKARSFSDERRGTLIVLDADTGAILAAPSAPAVPAGASAWDLRSFDLTYAGYSPMKHSGWEVLNRHYAPGSTFKPMNALLAARVDGGDGWDLRNISSVTYRKSYAKLSKAVPGMKISDPEEMKFGSAKWGWNPSLKNFSSSGIKWNDPKGIGLDVGIEKSLNVYMAYLTLARHQSWLKEELAEIAECNAKKVPDAKIYIPADALERSPLIQMLKEFNMIGESVEDRSSTMNDLSHPIIRPGSPRTRNSVFQPALGRVSMREQQAREPAYTIVRGIRVGCKGLSEQIRFKLALHGIGQGIALTPLEVARIAAVVAGAAEEAEVSDEPLIPLTDVKPFLIEPYPALSPKSRDDRKSRAESDGRGVKYSRDAIRLLANGMHAVVKKGTAEDAFRGSGLLNRGNLRTLFGKTGTADVRQRSGEVPFNSTWFMGWYESSDAARAHYGVRRLAFSCFLSHGYDKYRFGGQACAPVVADFLKDFETASMTGKRPKP